MKMPEISKQQKQYLARQKKEKHIILAARTLLFVLFMGLPFIFEGIYVMIKLCVNIGGKELPAENFGAFLMEKGWSGKAVCGLYAFSALAGGIAAVSAAVLYL